MSDDELNIEDILGLVEREGKRWTKLGEQLGEHPEKIRAMFRRWEGKHSAEAIEEEIVEEGEAFFDEEDDEIDKRKVYEEPEFTEGGDTNNKTLSVVSTAIHTLEQLLAICEVDQQVWEVKDHLINSWGVTMKIGTGENQQPVYRTNYQVKAWLRRKKPIAVIPVVSPIEIPRTPVHIKRSRPIHELKVALIGFDAHFGFSVNGDGDRKPFHDPRALDIFLQVAHQVQPDRIILGGDWWDLPGFSKYPQSPFHARTTQGSLISLGWYIYQLRKTCPASKIDYLSGNHEDRMHKAVMQNLYAAYELKTLDELNGHPTMSVPKLLALDKMDVRYWPRYPDDQIWLSDTMYVEHGAKVVGRSGRTASAIVNNSVHSVLFGHIHRWEFAPFTIYDRYGSYNIFACCPGCLCHVDGRVPGHREKVNWQQGFAIVYYSENIKIEPEVMMVRIKDGKASFMGGLYSGDENLFDVNIGEQITQSLTEHNITR